VANDEPNGEKKATPEEVAAHLEKMRAVLSTRPSAGRYKVDRADPPPPCLSDVGHGNLCVCEVCWQMRMLEVFPGAKVVAGKATRVIAPQGTGGPEPVEVPVAVALPPAAGFPNPAVAVSATNAAPTVSTETAKTGDQETPSVAAPESRLERLMRLFPPIA